MQALPEQLDLTRGRTLEQHVTLHSNSRKLVFHICRHLQQLANWRRCMLISHVWGKIQGIP